VLINKDSRGWILVCLLMLAGAGVVYFAVPGMGHRRLDGPSGGTPEGLILGIAGYAMMLFALLLGARKRIRTLRIGRAYWWCQGHVWLGLLSFPIIILHGGFKEEFWGGVLTQWIMWIFVIVWLSGIVGLILQQIMPNRLLNNVPMETIYEQIDHIIAQLRADAERIVKGIEDKPQDHTYEEFDATPGGDRGGAATAIAPGRVSAEAEAKLAGFYRTQVKPVLADKMPANATLARERQAVVAFAQLRDTLPDPLKKPVDDLAEIVEERRQLARQRRLHHIMHGWLFVHVPLSYALMVLATVHAFQALPYTSSPVWVYWAFAAGLGVVLAATGLLLIVGKIKTR
jgi:hypothetical protein